MKIKSVDCLKFFVLFSYLLICTVLLLPGSLFAGNLAIRSVSDVNLVKVLKAEETKQKVPIGPMRVVINNNSNDIDKLFAGPPVDEAWPKDGFAFVIIDVTIKAGSEKHWLDLVNKAELRDETGTSHKINLWHFKDAFRSNMFMDQAAGLGVGPNTRLLFNLAQSLTGPFKLLVDKQEVATLSRSTNAQMPGQRKSATGKQDIVYIAIEKVSLKPKPQIQPDPEDIILPFSQAVIVLERMGDWLHVRIDNSEKKSGWVHNSTVIKAKNTVEGIRKAGIIPSNLLYIDQAKDKSNFQVATVAGVVRISNDLKRAIPMEGNCLVFSQQAADKFRQEGGFALLIFGVEGSISSPTSDSLYIYSERDKQYKPISERLVSANTALVPRQ